MYLLHELRLLPDTCLARVRALSRVYIADRNYAYI